MNARLACLCVALLPLLATAQEPKPRQYDIIILGGGKSAADAQAALDSLRAKSVWMRLAHFPAVRQSDEYPGLKKGLYIAVLGLCAKGAPSDIKRLMKAVKALQPGAYTRTVKGRYGDPCPPVGAFEPPDADEKPHLDRIAKEPGSADAFHAYGRFLYENGRLAEASVMADQAVALDPNHKEALELARTLMVLLTD